MSVEQKQAFLREAILQKKIDPNVFFEYWSELDIEIDEIELQRLKQIVNEFFDKSEKQSIPNDQGKDNEQKQKQDVEEEEQFDDFQEAEKPNNNQQSQDETKFYSIYENFNWDFLNTKEEKNSPVKTNTPQKLQINNKSNNTNIEKTQKNKAKVKPQQKKQQIVSKKASNNIQQLSEQKPKVKNDDLLNQDPPKQQKTLTVRQVLQQSTLSNLKCLKLQPNILNHHSNAQIYIEKFEEIEDKSGIMKFMKSNIFLFNVKTIARTRSRAIGISWQVKRKHSDFQWLRNMLVKFYPGVVVPPLPLNIKNKDNIFGFQKKLEHFLLDCYRSPELKNSKYFQVFLSYAHFPDFQTFMKNCEAMDKPKDLNHIINMSGLIETLHSKNIDTYGSGLENYLNKTSNHLKNIKDILVEVNSSYQNISHQFDSLTSVFNLMAEQSCSFSEQKCYERLTKTYKQIGKLIQQHAEFCDAEQSFIDTYMLSHFNYEKDRLENIKSLIKKRSTFAHQYEKKQQNESKGMINKLFGFFGDKSQSVEIPSSNLETLSNQVGYFNNQLLKESVRCVEVMIESHVVHFSNYGMSRIDNVDKMQKIWSENMVELSKLNLSK